MVKSEDEDASFHSAAPLLDCIPGGIKKESSINEEQKEEGGPDPREYSLGVSLGLSIATASKDATTRKSRDNGNGTENTSKDRVDGAAVSKKDTSTVTEFPPLPPDVAKLDFLEAGIELGCQTFLRSEKLYTSKQFMELDVGELADRYTAFRKGQGTNLGLGNARVYINKYRRLLRDALGMASEGDVAKHLTDNTKVYCIVSPEQVSVAGAEAQENAGKVTETEQGKTDSNKSGNNEESTAKAGRTLRSRSGLRHNLMIHKEDSDDDETEKKAPALEPEYQIKVMVKAKPSGTARKAPPKSKNPMVVFLSMKLKEPGSLGMKIENTATGGLRISEIIKDLQAEAAGLKVGDIVASATVDSPVEVEGVDEDVWQKDMLFQDFISLAKSQKRPMVVHIRRGAASAKPAVVVAAEKAQQAKKRKRESTTGVTPVTNKKRNRVDKYLSSANQRVLNVPASSSPLRRMELQKALALGTKRYKPTHKELHERKLNKSRKLRMDIVRAFKLRMAADEMETLVPPHIETLIYEVDEEDNARLKERHEIVDKEGSRTQSTVRDMVRESMLQNIQRMREDANELYNHPEHKDWEENLKYLLDYKLREGHTMVSKSSDDKKLVEFIKNAKTRRRTFLNVAIKSKEKMDFMGLEVDVLNSIE
jgi:hypothetical protein